MHGSGWACAERRLDRRMDRRGLRSQARILCRESGTTLHLSRSCACSKIGRSEECQWIGQRPSTESRENSSSCSGERGAVTLCLLRAIEGFYANPERAFGIGNARVEAFHSPKGLFQGDPWAMCGETAQMTVPSRRIRRTRSQSTCPTARRSSCASTRAAPGAALGSAASATSRARPSSVGHRSSKSRHYPPKFL